MLAPNSQVSMYPWKDKPEKIPLAVRHIRTFLKANRPAVAAMDPANVSAIKLSFMALSLGKSCKH